MSTIATIVTYRNTRTLRVKVFPCHSRRYLGFAGRGAYDDQATKDCDIRGWRIRAPGVLRPLPGPQGWLDRDYGV